MHLSCAEITLCVKYVRVNMTHLEHLFQLVPNLESVPILDVGAGKGAFVIAATQAGYDAIGVEYNPVYIEDANRAAREAGAAIRIVQGAGEKLPFPDSSFGFVNLSEVIEHVDDPLLLLREVYRVLRPGGRAYLSAPNRFGTRDPHFHLYFVNWLPRRFANPFISLFGTHKNYEDKSAGRQNLMNMHYYTYSAIRNLVRPEGFTVVDIRAYRISRALGKSFGFLVVPVYFVARTLYFDSFHLLLTKTPCSL